MTRLTPIQNYLVVNGLYKGTAKKVDKVQLVCLFRGRERSEGSVRQEEQGKKEDDTTCRRLDEHERYMYICDITKGTVSDCPDKSNHWDIQKNVRSIPDVMHN